MFKPVRMFFPFLISTALIAHPSFAAYDDSCSGNTQFNVGAGVYDITGPAAEEGMMGYAMIGQQTAGLLQRLWARAFVIESACNNKRIVFVNVDLGHVFQAVREHVIQKLQAKYGDRYNEQNVLITATHEHSGPGGYSTYKLYDLTTFGFSRKNFDTIVDGIVAAVDRAEANLAPSEIKFAHDQLTGINFNRSPTAYLQDPEGERNRYAGDTDTDMSLIRFNRADGTPIGLINWFPIHGTSMNNKNHLINGDNKGYAEYLFEKDFQSDYGPAAFVAAFAQANAGDVSPNNGVEGGDGAEGIKDVEKAGTPQYLTAKNLFNQANEAITGGVDYRQTFIQMDQVKVDPIYTDGNSQTTCIAAIGVSMLAGTTDGEGIGKQGVTCDDVSHIIPGFVCEKVTTPCQGAKPIALQTGNFSPPWTPNILPLQVIRIGNLVIVATPMELTTMTGRRIREAVENVLPKTGNYHVVLSTLANAYAGYVATNEEYQIQRYEGASTHFGPWEQAALSQEFVKLTTALFNNQPVDPGPTPPDLLDSQVDLQPGVIVDEHPFEKPFGSLEQDVKSHYHAGDTVQAVFWGAHPKNNYHTQDSFFAVQEFINNDWKDVRYDRDWDTEYHWERKGISYSLITVIWRTAKDTPPGKYRIVQYGDSKALDGTITPYTGYSSVFEIK